ncbi:MAG: beta-propeller fold lactonase family protein [Opitutaceae bacterium]|nr:beta-propeller fold lactonase family protein [Verrucomicrobiales bacterium]
MLSGCSTSTTSSSTTGSASGVDWPGRKEDGSVLLPNMWSLRPVGAQIPLGDFPVNIALHPDGRRAAVLHSGHGKHEVIVVDIQTQAVVSRTPVHETFYGVAFSGDGRRLVCSGASDEVIHSFAYSDGKLLDARTVQLRPVKERGIPAGLALSRDGRTAYVANVWSHDISIVDLVAGRVVDTIALATNAIHTAPILPVAKDSDEASITKRAEAILDDTRSDDPFPYACVLDPERQRLYVSLWAQSAVAVIDLKAKRVVARWATEEHPNEMILDQAGRRLFVANANRNSVTVLDTTTGRARETLVAELRPNSPPGNTPNSLALSSDEKLLFVANANINTVAVFDVETAGRSRSMGFIPVGWYPTSVRVSADGRKLIVANGKGVISKANPNGPAPGVKKPAGTVTEYIGGLFQGTLEIVDLPRRSVFERQMKAYTAQAYSCMPVEAEKRFDAAKLAGNPIPLRAGDSTPIKYCIYVIKENRTYDQVLGDMKEGAGDPSLCLFPEAITPNHHQLARDFVLLDNFYVESEVSADGHEWTMGAYATDFVEKSWPLSYGHNTSKKYPYPGEGKFPIAVPAGGYLWDVAKAAGVTYRSYGEFTVDGKTAQDPATTRVSALKGNFDPWFRGFDMDYPDVKRTARFVAELKRFEQEGEMPRLQIVRLPNDHTSGASVGKPTPRAHVADNDLAFGQLVEAVSRSKFWPQTAIFVVEDDAQNGPDHIDAHRTIAYAISPYTRRGSVDSTMYSTSSMLRTMELILGLRPMSQFDAAATPMFNSFQATPDFRPYAVRQPAADFDEKNGKTAWGADEAKKMNFAKEDAADDLLLNEMIWRSVRGPNSPMPAPKRAGFVFAHAGGDGDDDD